MDSQKEKVCNITREQLNETIVALVAETMDKQSKTLAKIAKVLQITALTGEVCYISILALYMLYRTHYIGAALVAIICIAYDYMQCTLNKKDYYVLATAAGIMFGAAFSYIWLDGKAIHLCIAIFGIFLFRYAQLRISNVALNAADISIARGIILKEGLEDKDRLIVTTKQHKEFLYEWDEKEIIECLQNGEKFE